MSWNGWYLMRSMYLMIDVPKTVWVWMWSVNAWVSANGPLEKIDLLFWTYLYFELSVFSKYSKLFRIPTTFCKNYRTPQNIFILREWMWLSFVSMCVCMSSVCGSQFVGVHESCLIDGWVTRIVATYMCLNACRGCVFLQSTGHCMFNWRRWNSTTDHQH